MKPRKKLENILEVHFINTFDNLLTKLDKEQTIVALHGTSVSTCPEICKTGLKYKNPTLNSTALSQTMAYGQHDIHYSELYNFIKLAT